VIVATVEGSRAPVRDSFEFTRIAAFTDGVFAIAITLLVLSIDVPSGVPSSQLWDSLVDSWEQLFAYFLSFAVIGRFWMAHHRVFSLLHDFDGGLIVLNLVFLSLIVLVPFPTELLGEYGNTTVSVVLYAVVVGTASLLSWGMLAHARRRGHVRPDAQATARRVSTGILWSALVFYVSIPLTFVSDEAGQLFWLILLADVFRRQH
jgi:uncharacterized membrane protein